MDFTVDLPPTDVLDRAEAYFARKWPYGGGYSRNGNTAVKLVGPMEAPNEVLDFLKVLVLSVVTFGIYFIYWIFTHDRKIHVPTAEVVATPAEQGDGALVTVRADKPEYQAAIEEWAREELGAPR